MKKGVYVILLIGVFAVTMLASSVMAAQSLADLTNSVFEGFYKVASPILTILTGATAPAKVVDVVAPKGAEDPFMMFYVRLLSMMIVFAVVYASLKESSFFGGWPLWIVSLAVPILGVRFLKDEWLYIILVPQSTFAVAVTAGLPFVLFFFVIKGFASQTVRRTAWIFFGVVFLAMWSYYADSLEAASYIYPLTAVLAFIMAAIDGTIQKFFQRAEMERARGGGRVRGLVAIDKLIGDTDINFTHAGAGYASTTPASAGKKGAEAYRLDIKYLQKLRSDILRT